MEPRICRVWTQQEFDFQVSFHLRYIARLEARYENGHLLWETRVREDFEIVMMLFDQMTENLAFIDGSEVNEVVRSQRRKLTLELNIQHNMFLTRVQDYFHAQQMQNKIQQW